MFSFITPFFMCSELASVSFISVMFLKHLSSPLNQIYFKENVHFDLQLFFSHKVIKKYFQV